MNNQAMNEALDSLAEPTDPSRFVAANGLVLKLRRVSNMIVADASRRMKAPRPPRVFIPEKDREEENPNDPEYIEATRNYQYDSAMMAMSVYYISGTKVEELAGLEPPESPVWSEEILAGDPGAQIADSGPRRYLAWLRLYAVPNEDQMRLLNDVVRFSGGTLQQDVAQAQASFRDNEERDTIDGVSTPVSSARGDSDATAPGNGAGVRDAGSGGLHALPMGSVDGPLDLV